LPAVCSQILASLPISETRVSGESAEIEGVWIGVVAEVEDVPARIGRSGAIDFRCRCEAKSEPGEWEFRRL